MTSDVAVISGPDFADALRDFTPLRGHDYWVTLRPASQPIADSLQITELSISSRARQSSKPATNAPFVAKRLFYETNELNPPRSGQWPAASPARPESNVRAVRDRTETTCRQMSVSRGGPTQGRPRVSPLNRSELATHVSDSAGSAGSAGSVADFPVLPR